MKKVQDRKGIRQNKTQIWIHDYQIREEESHI